MSKIIRELKSLSGAVLGFTVLAIVTMFVWNLVAKRGPGPIGGFGSWTLNHASGDAYTGGAAPAMSVNAPSAYSTSNNLGPMI